MDDTEDNIVQIDKDLVDFNSKYPHLTPEKANRLKRQQEVLEAKKKLKALTPDSEWDLAQVAMQEVISAHTVANPAGKIPLNTKLIEEWHIHVKDKHSDDPDTFNLIMQCVPTLQSMRQWAKRPSWNEAIWSHIRDQGLFTRERRASMIEALYVSGLKGNMQAAKIYLTLSGDYSEKLDVKNDTAEKYKEINSILHNKNK